VLCPVSFVPREPGACPPSVLCLATSSSLLSTAHTQLCHTHTLAVSYFRPSATSWYLLCIHSGAQCPRLKLMPTCTITWKTGPAPNPFHGESPPPPPAPVRSPLYVNPASPSEAKALAHLHYFCASAPRFRPFPSLFHNPLARVCPNSRESLTSHACASRPSG
jgi:hypothetical protein